MKKSPSPLSSIMLQLAILLAYLVLLLPLLAVEALASGTAAASCIIDFHSIRIVIVVGFKIPKEQQGVSFDEGGSS